MENRKLFTAVGLATVIGLLAGITVMDMNRAISQEQEHTVTRDSVTLLLDWKVVPAGDFIHLYDSTPYKITNGHVAAKLPCDADGESAVKVVAGQAPEVAPVEMELVSALSKPGNMCIYHVDLPPEGMDTVTDLALLNPTDSDIRLPRTSSVVIGVNEIIPLGGEHM